MGAERAARYRLLTVGVRASCRHRPGFLTLRRRAGQRQVFEPPHAVRRDDHGPLALLAGHKGAVLDRFVERRPADISEIGKLVDRTCQLSVRKLALCRVGFGGHVWSVRYRRDNPVRGRTDICYGRMVGGPY